MYALRINFRALSYWSTNFLKAESTGGMAPGTGGEPKGVALLEKFKQQLGSRHCQVKGYSDWQIQIVLASPINFQDHQKLLSYTRI